MNLLSRRLNATSICYDTASSLVLRHDADAAGVGAAGTEADAGFDSGHRQWSAALNVCNQDTRAVRDLEEANWVGMSSSDLDPLYSRPTGVGWCSCNVLCTAQGCVVLLDPVSV